MFLLVDMHFRSLEWWDTLAHHPMARRPLESCLVVFPRQRGITLSRSVLTLAWHVARTDRESAVVFLGLSPPVSELISLFSLQQIDRIAQRHFPHLRPRWADSPAVWHEIFAAFQGDATSGNSIAQREWSTLAGEFRPPWHH
ncbi:MAG TPA: hypothetical protein VHY19_07270 [Steroidobacteraceae bacterium]|jgi:hypothetical protein|nr:hypothetical protein [Steroidobacteraceae bacterium]